MQPSLQLLEGFGLDVDDTTFIAAPSFVSAMESFTATRTLQDLGKPSSEETEAGKDASSEARTPDGLKEELVKLLFARYSPTSSNYNGLDVEVVLKLSTLVFFCNRPTVAALMVFGTDLGAINALLAAPDDPLPVSMPGAYIAAFESEIHCWHRLAATAHECPALGPDLDP